jgi:hypothetical protein
MNLRHLRTNGDQFASAHPFLPEDGTGGSEGGGGASAEAAVEAEAPKLGPNGFPLNVKPEAMPAEQQAAYWRHRARENETAKKAALAERDALRPKAEQYAALEQASRSEAEKAADEARAAGEKAGREAERAEALGKFAPRLVGAEFRAQLAGRMTGEQVAELVDGLNVSRFLTEDGAADAEAVARFVAAIPTPQPAVAEPAAPARQVRDIGGGSRLAPKVDGLQRGSDLYAARHGKKTSA